MPMKACYTELEAQCSLPGWPRMMVDCKLKLLGGIAITFF
jgi:hypothetical protein